MTHPISEPPSHPQVEPMRSAVERIAAFAAAARPAQLTSGIRHLFKRNILTASVAPSLRCQDNPSTRCANSSRNTGHRDGVR